MLKFANYQAVIPCAAYIAPLFDEHIENRQSNRATIMFQQGVRESMRRLPRMLQPLVTWVTGKPLDESKARLIIPSVVDVLVSPLLAIIIIYLLTICSKLDIAIAWPLIGVLWLLLVGILRKMQVTHLHHAIHNRLFEKSSLNKIYAKVIPPIITVQNWIEYRKEHLEHHNASIFTTGKDADAAFLAELGFLPGRSRGELWQNLWITILSPTFHALFLRVRLRSVLVQGKGYERVLAWTMVGVHLILGALLGLKVYLIAVFIPMALLYHVSALLQFLTEHAWDVTGSAPDDWDSYAARCWGRFCGEAYPARAGKGLAAVMRHVLDVTIWSVRMLLVHLPVRLACLVSDLPAHDWHHLAHRAGQSSRDWPRSLYLRQAAILGGDKPGFAKRELWGISNMIEHQFRWLERTGRARLTPSGNMVEATVDQQLLVVGE
ncbi:fatty acid desaturase [Ralstonia insidiosa]|nr:fatty acid desaturase [Ralstonia insidiosa]